MRTDSKITAEKLLNTYKKAKSWRLIFSDKAIDGVPINIVNEVVLSVAAIYEKHGYKLSNLIGSVFWRYHLLHTNIPSILDWLDECLGKVKDFEEKTKSSDKTPLTDHLAIYGVNENGNVELYQ